MLGNCCYATQALFDEGSLSWTITGSGKHDENSEDPTYSDTLTLDLSDVVPSIAGPKRPQDRVSLSEAKDAFREALQGYMPDSSEADEASKESFPASDPGTEESDQAPEGGAGGAKVAERPSTTAPVTLADGTETELDHGHVVIAAITSCTNTSNPSVMLGAGILARNAVQRGLTVKPWVKTSLAPGSQVVAEYLDKSGLQKDLDALGFNLVGFGCTTCIGNSGPLAPEISKTINDKDIVAAAVLSGNRNFEGRINQDVRANYLASPPLVVAYALAGTMDVDLYDEPIQVHAIQPGPIDTPIGAGQGALAGTRLESLARLFGDPRIFPQVDLTFQNLQHFQHDRRRQCTGNTYLSRWVQRTPPVHRLVNDRHINDTDNCQDCCAACCGRGASHIAEQHQVADIHKPQY